MNYLVRSGTTVAQFMLLAAAFSGCSPTKVNSPESNGNGTSADRLRIMVIPKGESHEFWRSVHAGVLQAANEFDVNVTFKGPKSEGDTSDQIEMVENALADQYDGICLAPTDAVALRRPVEAAIKNGTPVVIFDSGLDNMDGIVSYVATDNYKGGVRAGEFLASLLGGKGRVMLMRYKLGSNSTDLREQGFVDELKKHPDISFVVQDRYAGADLNDAIELAENLLSEYGDETDGIFCPNQTTTEGMLNVLWKNFEPLASRVKFVGFDSGTGISKGLEEKRLHGTILQDPVTMGHMCVKAMVDHLNGQSVDNNLPVPEDLATTDNLEEERIHRLLYPEKAE